MVSYPARRSHQKMGTLYTTIPGYSLWDLNGAQLVTREYSHAITPPMTPGWMDLCSHVVYLKC